MNMCPMSTMILTSPGKGVHACVGWGSRSGASGSLEKRIPPTTSTTTVATYLRLHPPGRSDTDGIIWTERRGLWRKKWQIKGSKSWEKWGKDTEKQQAQMCRQGGCGCSAKINKSFAWCCLHGGAVAVSEEGLCSHSRLSRCSNNKITA